jgi:hypothetical protein
MSLHVRHCLIPPCSGRRWHLSGGSEATGLGYLLECWPSGYQCHRVFTWGILFLPVYFYLTVESLGHACAYAWPSYHFRQWWDGYQYLSICCQVHVGSYDRVLSRQAMSAIASQGPNVGRAYPVTGAPGWTDGRPESFPGRDKRWNSQTGGEIMPTYP